MSAHLSAHRPAIFLDRDGTINEDPGFVHKPEQLVFLEGVPEALAKLKRAGFLLLVVTNQSGVARGFYDERDVQLFHEHMNEQLRPHGAAIDAFYFCPFHPDATVARYKSDSPLRKPAIGMFHEACRDFSVDVSRSFMVGDRSTDIDFGLAAGLRCVLLNDDPTHVRERPEFVHVASSLVAAADYILAVSSPPTGVTTAPR